jgi:hypothetical protein
MQPLDAGRPRVRQRRLKAALQIIKALRQRRKTFFTGVPIARRQVEERLRQPIALQAFAHRIRRMIVGKQEFHRGEARVRRRVETVEERHIGEHHGKIGGKVGHGFAPR